SKLISIALPMVCAAGLSACASYAPHPIFPPHLAQFAAHPYFEEECHARTRMWTFSADSEPQARLYFPTSSARERSPRCAYLHQDLNRRLALADRRFRDSNRCTRHTTEVHGIMQSDVRDCRNLEEGWQALRSAPPR